MVDFNIFKEDDYDDEENKEPFICAECKRIITGNYFYDSITQKVYCSKECCLKQIEKEYFD